MLSPGPVIFIGDDRDTQAAVTRWLSASGIVTIAPSDASGALSMLSADFPGIVLTHHRMDFMASLAFLQRAQAIDRGLPVVTIVAQAQATSAVSTLIEDAYEVLEEPLSAPRILSAVRRASQQRALLLENRKLARTHANRPLRSMIVGNSGAIERLRNSIEELAASDANVLLYGETGVGKDLVARCLHQFGGHQNGRYVAIDCSSMAGISPGGPLLEGGRGTFPQATVPYAGGVEARRRGTLFLDTVDSLSPSAQSVLLRLLEEQAWERVDSRVPPWLGLRVIASSRSDLAKASSEGRFLADLHRRLSMVELRIPSLRERSDDIPLLFEHFVTQAAATIGRVVPRITGKTIESLMVHTWPGNVRELRNVAERFVLGQGEVFVPCVQTPEEYPRFTLAQHIALFERRLIERCLAEAGGRIADVMKRLDVPRRTLGEKMVRLGLDRRQFKGRPQSISINVGTWQKSAAPSSK